MSATFELPDLSGEAAERRHITETRFWNELMHGVLGPRKGGAKVLVDAEDSALGVGKTSAAVALARLFARAFDYELTEDDLVLSGQEYVDRYQAHPPDSPSVLVLDELVGGGAGDSRRAMATKNVELARAWQVMRSRQVVTLTTLPSWEDADKRLRKLADYRCRCLRRPIGTFVPYQLGTFDFGGPGGIRFKKLDNRVYFPRMDDDELYQHITDRKDELQDSDGFDADNPKGDSPDSKGIKREVKIELAQRMRNRGDTIREIGDALGMSHTWVSKNTNPPSED